jgi:hypothetical protein
MNVETAKKIVFDERAAPFGQIALAACVLSSADHDTEVSLTDLVQCLKRGNSFERITAIDEVAALALYRRTRRRRKLGYLPYEDFITDAQDWLAYLKKRKLI